MTPEEYSNSERKSSDQQPFLLARWIATVEVYVKRLRAGQLDPRGLPQTACWGVNGIDPCVIGRWRRRRGAQP